MSMVTLPDSDLGIFTIWEQKSGIGRFIVARDPRIAFILANRVLIDDSKAFGMADAVDATLVQSGAKVLGPLCGAGEGLEPTLERGVAPTEFVTAR